MKKFLFAILTMASVNVFSQPISMPAPIPFIEVTGTAIKEVSPDRISISITLSDKTLGNEKYSIQTQEEKLKAVLTRLKISLDQLTLSDANSIITMERKKENVKISKQYTLVVSSAGQVSKLFDELYAIEIKEAFVSKVEHSKIDSIRKEVRIAAIKAAKEKADYLVAAIGEQTGKPLEIREHEMMHPFEPRMANTIMLNKTAESADGIEQPETSFKKFKVEFAYYIKYAIK